MVLHDLSKYTQSVPPKELDEVAHDLLEKLEDAEASEMDAAGSDDEAPARPFGVLGKHSRSK
ncbi:MAG TPA: hypothetical protein VKD22_07900 [Ramlibacter sp.]|nr:hypothetical protein [Ramlibacter sp.]